MEFTPIDTAQCVIRCMLHSGRQWFHVVPKQKLTLFTTEATQQKEHTTHNFYISIRCHFGPLMFALVFAPYINPTTLHRCSHLALHFPMVAALPLNCFSRADCRFLRSLQCRSPRNTTFTRSYYGCQLIPPQANRCSTQKTLGK